MEKQPPPDPGVALALGSAFLGVYAHGGFLCGLNRSGVFPGHIAGSSAGALAGGFYAAGLRDTALEAAVLSAALKRSYPDLLMPVRCAPLGIGILSGIMGGKRVVRHLRTALPVKTIEGTSGVKLSIAVTDLNSSEAIFLTKGSLAESIMASCAIPILLSGQDIDGRKYHDGGIIHDMPIEPFLTDPEIHTVIMHRISNPHEKKKKHLTIKKAFTNGHHMLRNALHKQRVRLAELNGKRVILLETSYAHPGLFQTQATKKRYFDNGFHTGLFIKQNLTS